MSVQSRLVGRIKRLEGSAPPVDADRERRIMELMASATLVSRGQMRGDVAELSEDELLEILGTDRDSFWSAIGDYARGRRNRSERY